MKKTKQPKRENPFRKIYDDPRFAKPFDKPLMDFPMLVDIELSNYCNLQCRMCGQVIMKRARGYMSEELFRQVIGEMAEHGAALRMIRWGEPLLNSKAIDFIKYAKSKGVLVHMTTNALLIDEEMAKKLLDSGIDSMIFSMQGATKEGYNLMRNTDQYDTFVENVKRLVKMRNDRSQKNPWFHISSTMTDETEEEIEAFKKFWSKIVDSVGVGKTNLQRLKHFDENTVKDLLKKERIDHIYKPCIEVLNKQSINWDGDVTACCGDYNGELIIGKLDYAKGKNMHYFWHHKKLNTIRETLARMEMYKLPLCKYCFRAYDF